MPALCACPGDALAQKSLLNWACGGEALPVSSYVFIPLDDTFRFGRTAQRMFSFYRFENRLLGENTVWWMAAGLFLFPFFFSERYEVP